MESKKALLPNRKTIYWRFWRTRIST